MGKGNWSYGSAAQWLQGPDPMTWRRTYSGRLDQVPVARQFAVSLFAGSGHEGEVAFIVTELASNAVRHTRSGSYGGWFGLELVYAEVAYIGVTDLGGGPRPTVLPESDQLEQGRGLRAVSALAVAIGIHGNPAYGHTVWADLDLRTTAVPKHDLAVMLAG
ncbi:ATP-binding protein [Thermoactinospora rubra]|uniref:ATP-binding protein n=1 Tax=Thermoactinospora rubra TaxID=1088767 RepID=UPI0011815DD9|nr:ATP-binding protein [Thermoactinospora rubra]